MLRKAKSNIAFLLSIVMLIGLFPIIASAADDEKVLTSINHLSAISAVNFTDNNSATLTVPYDFSGIVDFSNDLVITYNTSLYTSASASFPSGSIATINGDPVAMTVTYQKKDDETLYTTHYTINVVRASHTNPTFSGTISKSSTLSNLTFTAADFTDKYTKNDGEALAFISITGSDPTFGSLKLKSEDYVSGELISISDLENSSLVFIPTSEGTVSYTVQAYTSRDGASIGSAALTITVHANGNVGTVSYTTIKNAPVAFNSANFASSFANATGGTLSYVKFTLPATNYGKLYYNYTSSTDYDSIVSDSTKYYCSEAPDISHITFAPYSNYVGTVTISYKGYNTDGDSVDGKISIIVGEKDGSDRFNDVGKDLSWASEAIDYLYKENIITGVKQKKFNPHSSISRGDFTLMLCRAFNLRSDKKCDFSDVSEDSYYYEAISTAKAHGIGKGSKGKFNPKSALSRQDAFVLIVRALEASGKTISAGSESDLEVFSDSDKISSYATDAVASLVKANIIQGNSEKLKPKSSISRAEVAVILYRILTM